MIPPLAAYESSIGSITFTVFRSFTSFIGGRILFLRESAANAFAEDGFSALPSVRSDLEGQLPEVLRTGA